MTSFHNWLRASTNSSVFSREGVCHSLITSGMEGLKIEGDVCCTQCGAPSGKSVILGYKNKIGLIVYDTEINFFKMNSLPLTLSDRTF